MRLIAKDKNGDVVAWLQPSNIQWDRRYYGCGQFSIQLAAVDYSANMHHIDSPDRPERGIIQKVDFTSDISGSFIQISGFFSEKLLDDFVIHPTLKASGQISSLANMLVLEYTQDINVSSSSFADIVAIDDLGSSIGTKLFEILEPLEISYRISTGVFSLWCGLNRSQNQAENNRATFSTSWGNIRNLSVSTDDSNYRNRAVVAGVDDCGEYVFVEISTAKDNERIRTTFIDGSCIDGTYISIDELKSELKQYGLEQLINEFQMIEDVSFDLQPGGFLEYRRDFDIGDRVDVIIDELSYIFSARITEIKEVWKDNSLTMAITVGNKQRLRYKAHK